MSELILRKQDLNGKAAVYTAWGGKGQCFYVGMTSQGFIRPLTNPILRGVWDSIEKLCIEWCGNSDIARELEKQRITQLKPLLNRSGVVRQSRFTDEPRVIDALDQAGGNKERAAKLLGMSRATFYRRLSGKKPRKLEL